MRVAGHLSLEELWLAERGAKDAGRARRLRIIILAAQGWTAPAVSMAVGLSRRAVQDWVRRFNERGLKGLEDDRGRATRSPLNAEQQQAFRERLEAGPREDDQVCSLRGKDI